MNIFTFNEYKKVRNIRSKSALLRAKKRWKRYKEYKRLTGWKIIKRKEKKHWVLIGM